MNLLYTVGLINWGKKMAFKRSGKDTVELSSSIVYITGYNYKCDSFSILVILQH